MTTDRQSPVDRTFTLTGPTLPDTRRELREYLRNPTERNWNRVYNAVVGMIDGQWVTFWQAWVKTDKRAPLTRSRRGERVGWIRWPDTFTAMRALRAATALFERKEG